MPELPSPLEKTTAAFLYALLNAFMRSIAKLLNEPLFSRQEDEAAHPLSRWDAWTLPDRIKFEDSDWWYNYEKAIHAKRLFYVCLPRLAHEIDEEPAPRNTFRAFMTIASRNGLFAENVLELIPRWKEWTPTYWQTATLDMDANHGIGYGIVPSTPTQMRAARLARLVEDFRHGQLHVSVNWTNDGSTEKHREIIPVLGLGLHDSVNQGTSISCRARFIWPNSIKKDETEVVSITLAGERNYKASFYNEPLFTVFQAKFKEPLRFEQRDYILPGYQLPRWLCRRPKTVPIKFKPEDLGAQRVEAPTARQLVIQRTFEGDWWRLTREGQRRMAVELGLMLIDSLSLKRPFSAMDVDVLPDEAYAEDDEDPETVKLPNAQRWPAEVKKRPRFDYVERI